jgi:hypothetical protein
MEMTNDLRSAIARLDQLKPPTGGNVIDLERVRLQRELRAMQARMSESEWDDFTRGLVTAMAGRMRFGIPARRMNDAGADCGQGEP